MFDYMLPESILTSRIDSGRSENFYFLSKSFLEVLSNINYFTSKLILIKSISIKLILSKINFIKVDSNTH